MEVQVVKSLRADVDHDGSEDLLVHLGCHSGFRLADEEAIIAQVVAYSGDRVLGRVVASPPDTNAPFISPARAPSTSWMSASTTAWFGWTGTT